MTMLSKSIDESVRIAALLDAQAKAQVLFDEIIRRDILTPGRREREISDIVRDLATEMFSTRKFWHKRIVRSGVNTLEPYEENPPDRRLEDDDIIFMDFGPVFQEWEADFGRTYVLGNDPAKLRIVDELPQLWQAGKDYFDANPELSGTELFTFIRGIIEDAGWSHAQFHTGHLVGEYPHERISGNDISCYITLGNDEPMRRPDPTGRPSHWILEIHLIDPTRKFGGFHEQLVDI